MPLANSEKDSLAALKENLVTLYRDAGYRHGEASEI